MRFDETCVYYQPFAFFFANDSKKNVFPYSFVAPTAKSTIDIIPIAIAWGQVSIRCARAQQPKNGIYKPPCVFCVCPALRSGASNGMRLNNSP
jgi:hypothetical protein